MPNQAINIKENYSIKVKVPQDPKQASAMIENHLNELGNKLQSTMFSIKRAMNNLAKGTVNVTVVSGSSGGGGLSSVVFPTQGGICPLTWTGSPLFVPFTNPFPNYCNSVSAVLFFTNPDGSPGNRTTLIATFSSSGFYVDDLDQGVTSPYVNFLACGG